MSFFASGSTGIQTSNQNTEPFPDPFCDYASMAMPSSLEDALKWCEYIMLANGVYRSAIDRVVSYFITDVEIEGASSEEKEKWKDFLHDTVGIQKLLRQVALDYLTYGNSFTSLIMPFTRYLSCPKCGFETVVKRIQDNPKFEFEWKDHEFIAKCIFCQYSGKWTHIDRRSTDESALTIKRWSPHEIELLWDPYSDDVNFIWKIPQHYKKHINSGKRFHLERAPWEIIQAVKNDNHLRFDSDVIYHAKEETLAGITNKGWGVSRILSNFRQAWYVQVLHRYNEAIALDYVIPFRLITPTPRGGGESNDPLLTMDMGGFSNQVQHMLRKRRKDPAAWNTLPFPIQYDALGGEASALAPQELLEQGIDTLLNSVGVPVEFYKANLSIQGAPAALRLMESNWSHLTYMMNRFLQWAVRRVSSALSWDEVTVRMAKPSAQDDLNKQMAKLQLMMGKSISQTTGLKSVGIDYQSEQKKMFEEEKFMAEESQKAQEEIEASGLGDLMASGALTAPQGMPPGGDPAAMGGMPPGGGGMPPGGGGMPPGGGAPPAGGAPPVPGLPPNPVDAILAKLPRSDMQPITPQELQSMAQTTAQEIFALPETAKDSALIRLKKENPTLHALVKSQLEDMRNQGAQQGIMMQQQAARGGQ